MAKADAEPSRAESQANVRTFRSQGTGSPRERRQNSGISSLAQEVQCHGRADFTFATIGGHFECDDGVFASRGPGLRKHTTQFP